MREVNSKPLVAEEVGATIRFISEFKLFEL
jgi:hypothetical protein